MNPLENVVNNEDQRIDEETKNDDNKTEITGI